MELQDEILLHRCVALQERIRAAERRSGRQEGTTSLIAVSKTVSAMRVREAYAASLFRFGENRVQELLEKQEQLDDLPLEWHLIGQLQTNKVKDVLGRVALIHSLDRINLAQELQRQAVKKKVAQVHCLVEVNVAGEESKAGFTLDEAAVFVEAIREYPNLIIDGFMTVAPQTDNPETVRPVFRALATLRTLLRQNDWFWAPLRYLSMGMSGDFEIAIEEGADFVRVGTAIFGSR